MLNSLNKNVEISEFLESDFLTQPTSEVLTERLNKKFPEPKFFDQKQFDLLAELSQVLMGDEELNSHHQQVAGMIDERLSQNKGDGWRYDEMPPDQEMYLSGLNNLEKFSHDLFGSEFTALTQLQKIQILEEIQQGKVSKSWTDNLNPKKFFVEILAEIAENYYSFPEIQLEMGYAGMADKEGWEKIGLNETEPAEKIIEKKFSTKKYE